MSLYADICRDFHADDDDVEFDEASETWTVKKAWGVDEIRGLPDKEMALAFSRAIYAAHCHGVDSARYG